LLIPSMGLTEEVKKDQSSCVSCHLDMGGTLAEPVTLWKESIHYKMGNNCEGCHGGDPLDAADAMSSKKGFVGAPKKGEVSSFCGKCHVGVMENYKKSPHYRAALKGKGPTCTTCHNSHNVQKASFDLINEKLCTQCHSFQNGRKIREAFVSAETALNEQQKTLNYLEHRGMPVKRMKEELFALRNSLHQMTHTLDFEKIRAQTGTVLKKSEEMDQELKPLHQRVHHRWFWGSLVAAFFILLLIVLIQLKKTYEDQE
ncbi:MAG: cytochrome c3 family protein, partial [bacterium]|nr:cytochrome c3 family protein [bacterium]